ncbi:MAG: hypothetical protein MJY85_00015 [Fibrobacter sp.]|nr:hypothetical protein [Fibrobacter sp.]
MSRNGAWNGAWNDADFKYDDATRTVYLGTSNSWAVLDLNGTVIKKGTGNQIQMSNFRPGVLLVRSGKMMMKISNK